MECRSLGLSTLSFQDLLFHAEEGKTSNRKECKASLGFVKRVLFKVIIK